MHYFIAFELYRANLADWERQRAIRELSKQTRQRSRSFPRLSLTVHRRRARSIARAASGAHACR